MVKVVLHIVVFREVQQIGILRSQHVFNCDLSDIHLVEVFSISLYVAVLSAFTLLCSWMSYQCANVKRRKALSFGLTRRSCHEQPATIPRNSCDSIG